MTEKKDQATLLLAKGAERATEIMKSIFTGDVSEPLHHAMMEVMLACEICSEFLVREIAKHTTLTKEEAIELRSSLRNRLELLADTDNLMKIEHMN